MIKKYEHEFSEVEEFEINYSQRLISKKLYLNSKFEVLIIYIYAPLNTLYLIGWFVLTTLDLKNDKFTLIGILVIFEKMFCLLISSMMLLFFLNTSKQFIDHFMQRFKKCIAYLCILAIALFLFIREIVMYAIKSYVIFDFIANGYTLEKYFKNASNNDIYR